MGLPPPSEELLRGSSRLYYDKLSLLPVSLSDWTPENVFVFCFVFLVSNLVH